MFDEGIKRCTIAVTFAAVVTGASFVRFGMIAVVDPEVVQGFTLSAEVEEDGLEVRIPLGGLVFSFPDRVKIVVPIDRHREPSREGAESALADAFGNLEDEPVDDVVGGTSSGFIFVCWSEEALREIVLPFERGPVFFCENEAAF